MTKEDFYNHCQAQRKAIPRGGARQAGLDIRNHQDKVEEALGDVTVRLLRNGLPKDLETGAQVKQYLITAVANELRSMYRSERARRQREAVAAYEALNGVDKPVEAVDDYKAMQQEALQTLIP